MVVFCAAWVECCCALRAGGIAIEIVIYCEGCSARTAKYCKLVSLGPGPNFGRVLRNFCVAFKTRIPSPAAFKPEGDDIELAVPMCAPRFGVYVNAVNVDAVNVARHRGCGRIGLTERMM